MDKEKLVVEFEERALTFEQLLMWRLYKAFARANPLHTDEPFYYPFSVSVDAGESKVVRFDIPEKMSKWLFIDRIGYDDKTDVEYEFSVDGESLAVDRIKFDIQDKSQHFTTFRPPKIAKLNVQLKIHNLSSCLLYTSPSPRDKRQSRMPSSA